MTDRVTKAVIAAAGFGTRFLPQTKAMPKEMLPIIDKPIIQYVVEELVSVGVQDIVIVTGYNKRSVEDHFDRPNQDLVANLQSGGPDKLKLLDEVEKISNLANFIFVRQKGPYGNGTPLLNVEHLIDDEPFIFTFSDDFIQASPTRFQQMIDVYQEYRRPVMSSVRVKDDNDYNLYGFAGGETVREGLIDVKSIVEKPGKDNAPSNMTTCCGYLLTPDIFKYLHQALDKLPDNKEFLSNDALKLMVADGRQVMALEIANGKYYDTGNKLEYLKTIIDFGLKREDMKDELTAYIKNLLGQ